MDPFTSVPSNGLSTAARFNFEAFRFVQHRNLPRSSIYVHCILRLCEPSKCQELLSVSKNKQTNKQVLELSDGRLQEMKGDTHEIISSTPPPHQKCVDQLSCFVFSGLRWQEEESAHSLWRTERRFGHALSWTYLHSQRRSDLTNKQTQWMTKAFC